MVFWHRPEGCEEEEDADECHRERGSFQGFPNAGLFRQLELSWCLDVLRGTWKLGVQETTSKLGAWTSLSGGCWLMQVCVGLYELETSGDVAEISALLGHLELWLKIHRRSKSVGQS